MFDNKELVENLDSLRKFALRLTGNISDAEDLLHSVVLRAIEKKALFEPGSNLLAWTSKIMFNTFATQYRRKVRFETKGDPDDVIEKESIEAVQETSLQVAEMMDAMKCLSHDQQEILILAGAKGQKYEEVARTLDIPVGTVRSRLARARSNLQAAIEHTGPYKRLPFGALANHYKENRRSA